jgi:hypothetical protein
LLARIALTRLVASQFWESLTYSRIEVFEMVEKHSGMYRARNLLRRRLQLDLRGERFWLYVEHCCMCRPCSAPLFWADRSVLIAGIVFMV